MDHALSMGLVERVGNRERDRHRLLERERAACQTIGERLAFHELHDQEGDVVFGANVVQHADVSDD